MKSKLCTILTLLFISIAYLQAQDYLISFAGSGSSTTVDSVKVENLIQGTKLKMKGSDVLHLLGVVTGIETVRDNGTGNINFYPNPMNNYSRMHFVLPESGETIITLYDLSGRKLVQTRDLLQKGQHTYGIQDVKEGIYFLRINCTSYSFSGKLISSSSKSRNAKIVYENTENAVVSQEKQSDLKGTNEEKVFQYATGDRLKFIGISGNYSTVITDVPTTNKIVNFNFIPCTDKDGNNYPVVQIGTVKGSEDNIDPAKDTGSQIWMAENLKTTTYLNGDAIPNVTNNSVWNGLTTGAYCWFDNNSAKYKNTYGALYNWYAGTDSRKICPTGWHVPIDKEWTILSDYLGGEKYAGGKLKETGSSHWEYFVESGTNETGFTALPGGERMYDGRFDSNISGGYWWSATENEEYNWLGWFRLMNYMYNYLYRDDNLKIYGHSVRCIKD